MINRAAHLYAKPALEPSFEEIYIDDKTVLIVNISSSDTKPHYALGEDKKWWVYVRIDDKSVLASAIVVEVLKRGARDEGVFLAYTINEKKLLEYLDVNKQITAKEYSTMLSLSRRNTQRILVNLVLSGIIKMHTSEKEEYYTAS
jgi:predicted HTH transcriptional regulator